MLSCAAAALAPAWMTRVTAIAAANTPESPVAASPTAAAGHLWGEPQPTGRPHDPALHALGAAHPRRHRTGRADAHGTRNPRAGRRPRRRTPRRRRGARRRRPERHRRDLADRLALRP